MTQTLHHADILAAGTRIRLTRATLSPNRPRVLHDHDFYELFWVQNGRIRHHLPEGADILNEGDVVFLRPGQAHALQGRGEHALVVSLCIHPAMVKAIAKRHPSVNGHLFWSSGGPVQTHRDIRQLAALNHAGSFRAKHTPEYRARFEELMKQSDAGKRRLDKTEERMTRAGAKKFEDIMGDKEAKMGNEDKPEAKPASSGNQHKPEAINPRGSVTKILRGVQR